MTDPSPKDALVEPRHIGRNVGAMLAVGLVAAAVWAAVAGFSYLRARDASLPLPERYAAATQALKLAPWISEVRARQGYLHSQVLFAEGRTLAATDAAAAAYKDAVGDREMLAWFRKMQDALSLETNRKAHLQHGHEGPGGTLKPSDIER